MREQLTAGDVAARKAYLGAVVDKITVSDRTIRTMGSKDNIRSTFRASGRVSTPGSQICLEMARRKGFEPLTPRFEVWCSIQLSYRRIVGRFRDPKPTTAAAAL